MSIGKRKLYRKEENIFLLAAYLDSQLGLANFFIYLPRLFLHGFSTVALICYSVCCLALQ